MHLTVYIVRLFPFVPAPLSRLLEHTIFWCLRGGFIVYFVNGVFSFGDLLAVEIRGGALSLI